MFINHFGTFRSQPGLSLLPLKWEKKGSKLYVRAGGGVIFNVSKYQIM
jgi:hypothetical protein